MKKLFLIFIFVLTLNSLTEAKHFMPTTNIGTFYNALKPYGEWIYLDDDLIVWRPLIIKSSWRPYSEGRWVWTRYGWYWDSFEPFGWATFHYGRWIYDDYYGWVWIPDYQWAPSWVEWRYSDDYIGWAPLPPYASFRINFGIHFSIEWKSHYSYWNFVHYNNFYGRNINVYLIAPSKVEKIFNRTKYRTNYYMRDREIYNGGIDRNFVERKTGTKISEIRIKQTESIDRISRNGEKEIVTYRPVESSEKIDLNEIKRGDRKINIDRNRITIGRNKLERTDIRDNGKRNSAPKQKNEYYGNEKFRKVPEENKYQKPVIKKEKNLEIDIKGRINRDEIENIQNRDFKSNNRPIEKTVILNRQESISRSEKSVLKNKEVNRKRQER